MKERRKVPTKSLSRQASHPRRAAQLLKPDSQSRARPAAFRRSIRRDVPPSSRDLVRRIDLSRLTHEHARAALQREWLLTNGLGGYASGTISGAVTWRYHGFLIAALPAPLGRVVMFNHLSEFLSFPDGRVVQIAGEESARPEQEETTASHCVTEFRLENLLPVWRYEVEDLIIEKRVVLIYGQNTVHLRYRLFWKGQGNGARSSTSRSARKPTVTNLECEPGRGPVVARLNLRPSFHFRPHGESVGAPLDDHYACSIFGDRYEIRSPGELPDLRLMIRGLRGVFTHDGGSKREIFYQKEAERGYESRGMLWSPGYFSVDLQPDCDATLIASTEEWPTILALEPREALSSDRERRHRLIALAGATEDNPAAELVLAADQFIITPAGRIEDAARARAAGDEVRTVIAGYHWFTDWGRDTMISLEGLTLSTGRHTEAGWILRTFAHYVRDGLIPNFFPDGENEGLYHTADATLWFFHALDRYAEVTGDRAMLKGLLPVLVDIIDHHIRGTKFGIGVDPKDGLLRQGAEGYQLTWMDAKVEGWVVTPRRGKAVEINALWYNALRLLEHWLREEKSAAAAKRLAEHAERARQSFNDRFWYEEGGYLYDVVDGEQGDDVACRPNQILSFSLKHPILAPARWKPVLEVVRERLLTPVGLRTLTSDHSDYKPKYFGDLRSRDAAYHQGTVWAWLIGPFVDAWLRVHPDDRAGARALLEGLIAHLDDACIGSVSEIFDAEPPFTPRGCIAQAWSVAETLRCWLKTSASAGKRPSPTKKNTRQNAGRAG